MIYEYKDANGHTVEKRRKVAERHDSVSCAECGEPMYLIISLTHRQPDGIYSYAPNIGDANTFERRQETLKAGKHLGTPG